MPGTGTRHLSAQKMTKETQAIAFVVSEDRPITVFFSR
ncbi:MAG: DNA integrity scanning protein DisA nucleotide-binding domain protein [Nostoc sp. NMS7]|nr:DNA integrity scanning protein DisA nucleotide-binding domain protein [Nostoc sp. NMS7]